MLLLSHFQPPSPYPASHRDRLHVMLMDAAPVVKWHLYITVIPADNYIATLPVNDGQSLTDTVRDVNKTVSYNMW